MIKPLTTINTLLNNHLLDRHFSSVGRVGSIVRECDGEVPSSIPAGAMWFYIFIIVYMMTIGTTYYKTNWMHMGNFRERKMANFTFWSIKIFHSVIINSLWNPSVLL